MSRMPNGSPKPNERKGRSLKLSNPAGEHGDLLGSPSSSNVRIDVRHNFERQRQSVPSEKPTEKTERWEGIATAALQTSLPVFVNMVVMVTLIFGGCCA